MEHKLLLLGLLSRQEMHGYQLFEFIDRDLSVCTDITKPTAYYTLNKMAQDGWIAEDQVQEGNRPPRKVYRLTQVGEAASQRLLRENLSAYLTPSFSGDIGLAFLDALEVGEALALLEQRRAIMAGALEAARAVPAHGGSLQWVVDHQVRHLTAELEWMDEILGQLRVLSLQEYSTSDE